MKYIKSSEEFVNEGMGIKIGWKQLLMGIGIIYGLNYYFGATKKLSREEIDKIVFNVANQPTVKDSEVLNSIKKELIEDIKNTKKLDSISREYIIQKINNVDIVCLDNESLEAISQNKDVNACYFKYLDSNLKIVKVILIKKQSVHTDRMRITLIHELRHLVDDMLVPDNPKKFVGYSEVNNVLSILDKDIIEKNERGEKKLKERIKLFSEIYFKNRMGSLPVDDVERDVLASTEDNLDEFLSSMDMEYLASPAEVYARFHELKRWMVQKGYLKDINDEVTQDNLIKVFNDKSLFKDELDYKINFFEILFFLKVDFTGKEKNDFTKANSIVANYTDYLGSRRDA